MGKKEEALAKTNADTDTANSATQIMALQPANSGTLAEVIKENFGATGLRLVDLDRIKLPGAGGVTWEVPSIEDDAASTKELVGVIIGWADKKAWWPMAFGEDGSNTPPSCKSEDMIHGKGLPTLALNAREEKLIEDGKAQAQPVRDTGGWLCRTCPHDQFGSALKGGGKSCQDKRFLIMLLQDAVLPVLVRAPATSLIPLRNYFKRLASSGKRYYGVVTSLTLKKEINESNIPYSVIVPTAKRFLTEDEIGAARAYHELMQPMLEREGAVEAGLAEKGSTEQQMAEKPGAVAGEPADAAMRTMQRPADTSGGEDEAPAPAAAGTGEDQKVF